MAFQKERSPGFLANQMARLFAKGLQQRIRPLGLAPAQFMTLLALWDEDGQTQSELVRRLDVEQATMANTLTRMERDGLIERRTRLDDGRSQSIHMTPKAIALRDPATQAARAQNETALADFTEQERQVFVELMRRAIAAMHRD
ncbi:MarR family transcriptional regulator [Aminobacter sp. AP02]|uniref:MarR family winged helix-turn-helix transcriptional regulator n=1 Tax=Aminobacter sp. AP02 TaxID=2135737 RepID=UPI000D6C7A96|nr:MarR family transcriptional regulator [Aminobacter sp. AP02]